MTVIKVKVPDRQRFCLKKKKNAVKKIVFFFPERDEESYTSSLTFTSLFIYITSIQSLTEPVKKRGSCC